MSTSYEIFCKDCSETIFSDDCASLDSFTSLARALPAIIGAASNPALAALDMDALLVDVEHYGAWYTRAPLRLSSLKAHAGHSIVIRDEYCGERIVK